MATMSFELGTDRLCYASSATTIWMRSPRSRPIPWRGTLATVSRPTATLRRLMAPFLGHWTLRGHGQYAVEERASRAFVGRVGPWHPRGMAGTGDRLADRPRHVGRGYAPEAAHTVAPTAVAELGVDG
ncbi:MAG TPA: GNAT family protein [Euzebyales bacterium]|nr:GNAT family protein [Euzebyales bacterium]